MSMREVRDLTTRVMRLYNHILTAQCVKASVSKQQISDKEIRPQGEPLAPSILSHGCPAMAVTASKRACPIGNNLLGPLSLSLQIGPLRRTFLPILLFALRT